MKKNILIICLFIFASCSTSENISTESENSIDGTTLDFSERDITVQKNSDSDTESVLINGDEIFKINGTSIDNTVVGNILVSNWTGMGGKTTSIYDIFDKRELMNIPGESSLSSDEEYIYTCSTGGQGDGFFGYYSVNTLKNKDFSDEINTEGSFTDCTYSDRMITANLKSDSNGEIIKYIIDIENDSLSEGN